MVNFGEAGRICLNQEMQGACENCLWWEWDARRGACSNSQYHICPLYRERLFNQGAKSWSRFKGVRHGARLSSDAASADPLDVKAEESGIS